MKAWVQIPDKPWMFVSVRDADGHPLDVTSQKPIGFGDHRNVKFIGHKPRKYLQKSILKVHQINFEKYINLKIYHFQMNIVISQGRKIHLRITLIDSLHYRNMKTVC